MKRVYLLGAVAALCSATLFGQSAGGPAPARQASQESRIGGGMRSGPGLSAERLERLDRLLRQYVDENRLARAVVLVLRDGQTVYERAVGWSDKEAGRRMTTDTVFRIASQPKAITSTAVLMLMEEGKVGLNDPVSRFLPPFAKTTVAVKTDTGVSIVPAKRQITDSRSPDAHGRHFVRRAGRGCRALRAQGAGAGRRLRLVHRGQERAHLRHDGEARVGALRGAARRSLGVRV